MGKEKNSESSSSMPNLTRGTMSAMDLRRLKRYSWELFSGPGPISESVRIHDVFLSFRGVDTRSTFVSHLYTALRNAEIKVFQDDSGLQRGDYISTSLLRAIEESQISLIVFSKNYANSKWCLDELDKIMMCYRTIGQKVVPVFYHLEPSEVRHQTGEFGVSFQSLLDELRLQRIMFPKSFLIKLHPTKLVQNWREDLRQAASIAGFEILKSRNESEYIKAIVDHISDLLNKTDLFISDNPVGIQSRVKDVINCLDFGSNGVQLVGMWGMGGIGKTTIAKAVYNKIGREFEGRSFLANIREVWKQDGRQMDLQEQLLSDICKEITKISYIDKGKNTLKDKLCGKRVLIVLDDVSTLDQLNTLCGSREWFGKGSVIIITTRDLVLLRGRVDRIYTMTVMNESESIELFSWNAFKQARPKVDFSEISMNVVKYSGGLPLALGVLGCYLFARGVTEWQCVLEKLKRIPNDQVQKKLRISYDDLEDTDEQEIFLDIACFLIGMDRNDVILILNDCGLHAEIGISVLVERSLVSVDDKNRLGMHDLLRDMGRGIVREESPKSPEKRSRLLYPEDVIDVLSKQTGEESVMGLPKANKYCKTNENFFSTNAFEKMRRLRLLQLAEVKLDGDFRYVSRELRLLSWNGLSHIPKNFTSGEKLVSIELENANVHLLWNESRFMPWMKKLKVLNLSHSHNLTESPDFFTLPNLEKIVLKDCRNLTMVSYSIVFLNRVLLINLQDCISLCSLPRNIYKLKSLKTLILSGCKKLKKLEEDLEQMESLTTLLANETAIKKVPFSIFRSKTIWYISLCGYEGLLSDVVPSMIWSWMSPTSALSYLCQRVVAMSFIVSLDIHIPHGSSSQELSSLFRSLQLSKDGKIILDSFYATLSKDLASTSATSSVSKDSLKYDLFDIGMNCQNTNNLTDILQNTNRSDGPTALLVKNHTKATIQFYKRGAPKCRLRLLSSIEPGNKVEVAVVYENNFIVEQTFLYLVYDEPDLTSYRKKKKRVE